MAKVKDKDRGYQAFKKQLEEISGHHVVVGIRGEAGAASVEDGGPTVAQYATWNEFGTETIPERSFLRSTVDENKTKYFGMLEKALGKKKEEDLDKALAILGEVAASDVRAKIVNGPFVPNSPATIAAKGSSKPLIDTGTMRNAVSYEVRKASAK